MDDFNSVAFLQLRGGVRVAPDDGSVQFDDHAGRADAELFKQFGDADAVSDFPALSVDLNSHDSHDKNKTVPDATSSGNTV